MISHDAPGSAREPRIEGKERAAEAFSESHEPSVVTRQIASRFPNSPCARREWKDL